MEIRNIIVAWLSATARMLALVAALVLAVSPGLTHARASGGADSHSRAVEFCHKTEFLQPSAGTAGGMVMAQTECMHIFDPLQRPASASSAAYMVVAAPLPQSKAYRQHFASFDPPPPRSFS
ncbi:MAG: hypothetical protein RH942_01065 [Kiloniellaceae bacterium]